jgi:hypothetical protein
MRLLAIEIECTAAQLDDLIDQLERQCIQTVEYSEVRHPSSTSGMYAIRVVPHFGDLLDAELVDLITGR